TAWLNGTLGGDLSSHEVYAYWGSSDGGTNPVAWSNTALVGLFNRVTSSDFTLRVSGLGPNTTNYFTFAATEGTGLVWAGVSLAVTTEPFSVPAVENAATGVLVSGGADLNGVLTSGELAHVLIYFGETDGGTDPGAWDQTLDLGILPDGAFTTFVGNLVACQPYYFRARATNTLGEAWADSSGIFQPTNAMLIVSNRSPSELGDTFVTLNVGVVSEATRSEVWLYYGSSDGGIDPGGWDQAVSLGSLTGSVELLSHALSGLSPGQTVFYRWRAANCEDEVWSAAGESLTTLAFSHSVKVRFCGYDRPETLTNFPALVLLDHTVPGFGYATFTSAS
ncbi:MAG: hypothetical protein AAF492_33505, partial [Verrucomicrobiota bacterium]